jgi:homoserine kinase
VEFEDVLSDVMKELKTEYFKNDVIRTLQIVKFLMISNPKKFVDVLYNNLSQSKTRELLSELLNKDEIIKEFRKTNEDRLAMILKGAMIKPEKLAKMLEKDVLNRRTRKPFITSLMEQKKIGKVYKKELQVKKEKPLSKFFG